jgi:hypothetical protein
MRILNTEVPCRVSHKASAGRNASELKAAVKRLTRNDKSITDLTLSWALIADEGCRVLAASLLYNTVLTKLDLVGHSKSTQVQNHCNRGCRTLPVTICKP